jgi:hypothetical protein
MTKNSIIIILGTVTIASLTYGAYSFGRILTERPDTTIDERLELMKSYQKTQSRYDQVEIIKSVAAARRPKLILNFAAAGDCEAFLSSTQGFIDAASKRLAIADGVSVAEAYQSAPPITKVEIDNLLAIAFKMADAYDDCLGNP